MTVSKEHSYKGYSVRAAHYLLKPVSHADFLQAMEFCEILPKYDVPMLSVTANGIPFHIDTGNILYIEYRGRRTHICLIKQELTVSGTFSGVTAPLLADKRFLHCIRGLLVNMQHIDRQQDHTFVLTTGHCLPINIRGKKAVLEAYRRYRFQEMGERG